MSKNLLHLSLSIGSGLALGLAWPTQGLTLMIFVALIPLLYLEEDIGRDKNKRKGVRVFAYSYLTFLIWNLITTWWLINSSVFGMLFVNLTNSLLYTLIFSLFQHATFEKVINKERKTETKGGIERRHRFHPR